jgi:Carboxypeptidase regulatory-like domain
MQSRFWRGLFFFVICTVGLPALAAAQSQITGLVRDESGAVLPGVTVEAASPVLIEKSKTAVTDAQGRYTIVDLRPGTYKITFTLTGFATVAREALELPANFVATVNVDMKVGSLEETFTVTGQTPLVDVTQAARTQVVTRDMLDELPISRHFMSVTTITPGIRFQVPDIGGSRQMEQTYPRGHGVEGHQAQQMVDGMSITSNEEGLYQSYVNDALTAEVSVTTGAQSAETQGGGVRINMIPKDGGNIVSGSVFVGGTDGGWQANNIDDYLRSQNISRANGIAHIQTFNGSLGGPVSKDRIWFFVAAKHTSADELVANTPEHIILPDGTDLRSTVDQYIRDALGKVTWQINQKNKLSAFFDRNWKRKGHDFGAGTDPRAGSYRDPRTGHYAVGQIKWTNALTNRWLVEAGFSNPYNHVTINNRPEADLPNYLPNGQVNPAWLANARHADTANNINPRCALAIGCRVWVSNGQDERKEATAYRIVASVSYVTGSHNMKAGITNSTGPGHYYHTRQADLVQNYANNRPQSVTVYSTPANRFDHLNYDMGYYVQDVWTIKRLTVSPGIRVDNFNAEVEETTNPAGRFVPARFFQARKNYPNWKNDLGPRLSVAYDVFGDGRTALKAGFGKYYELVTTGWTDRYSTSEVTETRNWFDCQINAAGTACVNTLVPLPTDGDDIAQENEIAAGTVNFGLNPNARSIDPNIQRQGNREITASVSHQLFSRMSVTAGYYHRTYQDIQDMDRTLISLSDYSSFQLATPDMSRDKTLAGVIDPNAMIAVFNLDPAKRGVYNIAQVDRNVPNQLIYNGVDVSFNARLMQGSTLVGSWTTEKHVSVFCAGDDNPNGQVTADIYTGFNDVSNGGRYCDERNFKVPFTSEFKLAGNYPMRYGFDFGAVWQSYAGTARTITWQPAATQFPNGRTNTETIIMNAPGSLYYPRYNQLDVNFKKNFRAGRKTFSAQVDLFNALNGNTIFARQSAVGNSLGDVTTILQGRLVRLAFQMKF